MQRNKTFSIITIICFCSVIFIPIGLVLMWYSTQWSKKRKFILSGIMTIVYIAIVCFLMLFEPNQSGSGSGLPFGNGNQNVESQYESEPDKSSKKAKQSGTNPSGNKKEDNFPKEKEVNYDAENGDIVLEIYGVLFLIQRINDMNNVICFRIEKSNKTFLQALHRLRDYLTSINIQFLRVEGSLSRYFFLAKIKGLENYNVIQDRSITNRNVFYVRLY